MRTADLNDVLHRADGDSDVRTLIRTLKRVARNHGVWFTMRAVAFVLGPLRSVNFQKAHEVKATQALGRLAWRPSALVGKDDEMVDVYPLNLDHRTFWRQGRKLKYLTTEPYYIKKEDLKALIAHCDKFGIDFQIDAESMYYPGHCIRVLFKKEFVDGNDATAHEFIDVSTKEPVRAQD